MRKFSVNEDFKNFPQPKSSQAHEQATQLGLTYYGFGRYGKDNQITHITSKSGQLIPFNKLSADEHAKYQAYKDHAMYSKNDPEYIKSNPYWTGVGNEIRKNPDQHKEIMEKGKAYEDQAESFNATHEEAAKWYEQIENKGQSDSSILYRLDEFDWNNLPENHKQSLKTFSDVDYSDIQKLTLQLSKTVGAGRNTSEQPRTEKGDIAVDDWMWRKYGQVIKDMDEITRTHNAPMDITTFAGVGPFIQNSGMDVGDSFINTAFRSTSLSIVKANTFASINSMRQKNTQMLTMLQFDLKKGQQGFFGDGQNNQNEYSNEKEFILPRMMELKITDKKIVWNSSNNKPMTVYAVDIIKVHDVDAEEQYNSSQDRLIHKKNDTTTA